MAGWERRRLNGRVGEELGGWWRRRLNGWWERVGSWRLVEPSVRSVWTSYESKKCQP